MKRSGLNDKLNILQDEEEVGAGSVARGDSDDLLSRRMYYICVYIYIILKVHYSLVPMVLK